MKGGLQNKIFRWISNELLFGEQHQIHSPRLHRLGTPGEHGICIADKIAHALGQLGNGDGEGLSHARCV